VGIPAYERFREQVEEVVSRINGEMGRVGWTPIEYLYQSVSPAQLASLYRAASVMLVTPLRDGMNLVAKEYVAARTDHDGVLVLSEFAGSANELNEALTVNPYCVDDMSEAFWRALNMGVAERRQRMEGLRRTVLARDVRWWASTFLRDLTGAQGVASPLDRGDRGLMPRAVARPLTCAAGAAGSGSGMASRAIA
jgi:trehalose 6-phosphate synthase/phosphatase